MSELYHAKKKKKGVVIESLDTVSGAGKKIRSMSDRAKDAVNTNKESWRAYPKKSKNTPTIANIAAEIGNKAKATAANAKAAKALSNYGVQYKNTNSGSNNNLMTGVSNAISSVEDAINQPKALRKRLNRYQLKNIVAPKHYGR